METISVGKMDNMPPIEPKSGLEIFTRDLMFESKFVSSIKISAKKLRKQLKLIGDNKRPGGFDILNISLSNSEISISSLVAFSSPEMMEVLVQTNEPISFGVNHLAFRSMLSVMSSMSIGKEIDEMVLAYQPEENKLILKNTQSLAYIRTVPRVPKEISESLLHLELNN
ncbi:hypothetical protein MKW92_014124 [Papaver armeniacum]|nr:hypothetical protein MKW92_014124 [Papaver armeniacum]